MVTKLVLEMRDAKKVAQVSCFSLKRIIRRLVPFYGKRSKLKELKFLKSSSYFVSDRAKSPVKCPMYACCICGHCGLISCAVVGMGGLSGIEHPRICPYGAFYTEGELKSCWYEKLRV